MSVLNQRAIPFINHDHLRIDGGSTSLMQYMPCHTKCRKCSKEFKLGVLVAILVITLIFICENSQVLPASAMWTWKTHLIFTTMKAIVPSCLPLSNNYIAQKCSKVIFCQQFLFWNIAECITMLVI